MLGAFPEVIAVAMGLLFVAGFVFIAGFLVTALVAAIYTPIHSASHHHHGALPV